MTTAEDTDIAAGRRMSHAAQLSRHARKKPDAPALSHAGRTLTYAALNGRVCALARGLAEMGVTRGDRVIVLMKNRIEVVESYLAIVKLGAIAVPVNFRLTAAEVDYIVGDSEPTALLTDDDLIDLVLTLRRVQEGTLPVVHASESPAEGTQPYTALVDGDTSEFALDVPEDDPAFLMYTSGTTGRPKGALLTHMNLFMNSVNSVTGQGVEDDGEVWLSGLPLFHIGGLNGILIYLLVGGHSVLMDSGDFSAEAAVRTTRSPAATSSPRSGGRSAKCRTPPSGRRACAGSRGAHPSPRPPPCRRWRTRSWACRTSTCSVRRR